MKEVKPKVRKGVYYWPTREAAQRWANRNRWPEATIVRQYGEAFALQCGPSGSYAGPGDELPRRWAGVHAMNWPACSGCAMPTHPDRLRERNLLRFCPECIDAGADADSRFIESAGF